MRNKMNHFRLSAVMLVAIFFVMPLRAQVTIGEEIKPQPFSLLEISTAIKEGGLRMPQLTTAERDALNSSSALLSNPEAKGLIVYNTTTKCLEFWNGTKWVSLCKGFDPCSNFTFPITFMPYNLGADPQYDTPKKQMRYLAEQIGSSVNTTDSTVYGALYQWGRVSDGHQKRTSYCYDPLAPPLFIGSCSSDANHQVSDPLAFDANGQILSSHGAYGKFIRDGIHFPNHYDWRYPAILSLWGNGVAYNIPTPGGGVPNSLGVLYQNPVKTVNDPCPTGWRIPTQDEWERLVYYDFDPANVDSGYLGGIDNPIDENGRANNNCLTFVPVVCSSGSCIPNNSWTVNITRSGLAVYKTSDWDNYVPGSNLLDPSSPDPILFLPAGGSRNWEMGNLRDQGLVGRYWSSTLRDSGGSYFYMTFGRTYVRSEVYDSTRTWGLSIRCVAE